MRPRTLLLLAGCASALVAAALSSSSKSATAPLKLNAGALGLGASSGQPGLAYGPNAQQNDQQAALASAQAALDAAARAAGIVTGGTPLPASDPRVQAVLAQMRAGAFNEKADLDAAKQRVTDAANALMRDAPSGNAVAIASDVDAQNAAMRDLQHEVAAVATAAAIFGAEHGTQNAGTQHISNGNAPL